MPQSRDDDDRRCGGEKYACLTASSESGDRIWVDVFLEEHSVRKDWFAAMTSMTGETATFLKERPGILVLYLARTTPVESAAPTYAELA